MNESSRRSDWTGGVVGILVFFAGIALLLLTFKWAYEMFSVPPSEALRVNGRAPVELGRTAESFARVVERILLLLVMSAVSSVIANRGIRLYAESRGHSSPPSPPKAKRVTEQESRIETA